MAKKNKADAQYNAQKAKDAADKRWKKEPHTASSN